MRSCVFPGSFDPITRGHLDVIRRASALFDRVTVTVMVNIHKSAMISPDKRVDLIRRACADLPNVRVDVWKGLLVVYMSQHAENCILRGVRSGSEAESEIQTAIANRKLNETAETLLLPSSPDMAGISSSAVKEIFSFGGDIGPFVPEGLAEEIAECLSNH